MTVAQDLLNAVQDIDYHIEENGHPTPTDHKALADAMRTVLARDAFDLPDEEREGIFPITTDNIDGVARVTFGDGSRVVSQGSGYSQNWTAQ